MITTKTLAALAISLPVYAADIQQFEPGQPAVAAEVNAVHNSLNDGLAENKATIVTLQGQLANLAATPGPTGPAGPKGASFADVVVPDDTLDIASAVAVPGTVFVRQQPECYEVTAPIHIRHSRTQLIAEPGTCLKLADGANEPVILIGSSSETVQASEQITDIVVSGFVIDGNRQNQNQEGSATYANVQNNAIGIRGVRRAYLSNLVLCNARSGGLVISQRAQGVWVSNSTFCGNEFDGLAIDGASKVFVNNFVAEDNLASGVSIDTDSTHLQISQGLIQNNQDNGLFARFTSDSTFQDLSISNSCNFGVFLSHSASTGEGLRNVVFDGLKVFHNGSPAKFPGIESGPAGFNFSTNQSFDSSDNFLVNSIFSGNTNGGVTTAGAGLHQQNNIETANSGGTGPNQPCP